MIRTRTLLGSLSSLLLVSVSLPALAQATGGAAASGAGPGAGSQPPRKSGQLEEITVTARRVSERLQRVPIAVTALNAKELTSRGVLTITQLAEATPNLHVSEGAAAANTAVLEIRGQVQTDTIPTLDPSVGVYVDDVYYARAYSILSDLLDVQDVEVLKGPQGTLYGRNTIGGAIKITTRPANPEGAYSGYLNAGYGNYNAKDFTGAVNLPLIKDVLAIRFAASYHDHDGYTSSYLVPTVSSSSLLGNAGVATSLTPIRKIGTDNQDTNSERVSLRYTPTADITVDVTGSLFRSDNNGSLAVTPQGDIENYVFGDGTPDVFSLSPQRKNSFYAGLTDSVPFAKTNTDTAAATGQWNISDGLTTKLILGYVGSHDRSTANSDGTVTPSFAFFQFEPELNNEQRQVSAEYQLLGKTLNDRLSWILGLYYFKEDVEENQIGSAVTVFNLPDSVDYSGGAKAQSISTYGNATYSWTPKFRTNFGLRLTRDDKSIDGNTRIDSIVSPGYCIYSPGPGIITSATNGGPCAFTRNDAYKYITFDAGADYQLTSNVFVYAKVGDGYRGGGEQLRAIGPSSTIPFQPDRALNYEVGVKSELFDNHLRLNLDAFHTDFKNIQQTLIITATNPASLLPVTASVVVNQGRAQINGAEGEMVARVTENLTFNGDFGAQDVEFQDHTLRQQLSPKLVWGASAIYTQPTQLGLLTGRLDVSHTGSYYITQLAETPDSKLNGYTLLNGRVTLQIRPDLQLAIYAKNLTGQHYFDYELISGYSTAVPAFFGARGGYVGAPRTYGGQVSYTF